MSTTDFDSLKIKYSDDSLAEILSNALDVDPENDINTNGNIVVINRQNIGDAQKENKECIEQINNSNSLTIEEAKVAALSFTQSDLTIYNNNSDTKVVYEAYDGGEDIAIGSIVVKNGITYQYDGEAFKQMIDYDNKTITMVTGTQERTNKTSGEKYTYTTTETQDINFQFSTQDQQGQVSYTLDVGSPKYLTPEHEHAFWTYTFGIDRLALYHTTTYNTSCFISDEINIGDITDKTNLALEVSEYEPNNTSIEYYLIDGNKTISMYPRSGKTTIEESISYVKDELIFKDLPRRFAPTNSSDSIKKNGESYNVTFDEICFNNPNDTYTVSYYTMPTVYHPENKNVRIKIILRKYEDDIASPYVKYVNLIKIGGSVLWKDI